MARVPDLGAWHLTSLNLLLAVFRYFYYVIVFRMFIMILQYMYM